MKEDRLLAALVARGLLDSTELSAPEHAELLAWETRWGARTAALLASGRLDEEVLLLVRDELAAADSRPDGEHQPHDRYALLRPLGAGAMGEVFLARDAQLGRLVAIKLLSADTERLVARCLREARAQARVSHDGICQVYEAGLLDGRAFIAMRHIDGPSLAAAAPTLTLAEKVLIVRDIALALHEAHGQGVIHRDIKPSNVLLERVQGRLRPVVTDFGLALDSQRDGEASQTGGMIGTPAFMSPEQARGDVRVIDRRTDVYSLGATLYFLLVGEHPFSGDNVLDLMLKIQDQLPVPPRQRVRALPEDLEVIVLKCLAKDPSDRYESALALHEDLVRHIAGEPIRGRRLGRVKRLRQLARRHPRIALTGSTFGVALIVLGGLAASAANEAAEVRAHARAQAERGQQLGQEIKQMEWSLRAERLLPLHDTRPAEARVKARLVSIRQLLDGSAGDGPLYHALGRGHLALGDLEAAQRALDEAFALGERGPDLHWALGYTLCKRHDAALAAIRRTAGSAAATARRSELAATYLVPARTHLALSRGTEATSAGMLEALHAYSAGDLATALRFAHAAVAAEPMFYEARVLAGEILGELGHALGNAGDRLSAAHFYEAATDELEAAARVGRSDPALYDALAQSWIWHMKWKSEAAALLGPIAGGLMATDRSIAAASDHPGGHALRAWIFEAAYQGMAAAPVVFLEGSARAAAATLERAPDDLTATRILGNYLLDAVAPVESQALDPLPVLSAAQAYFERWQRRAQGSAGAANHVGVVHSNLARELLSRGLDPRSELRAAVAAYDRALELSAGYEKAATNAVRALAVHEEWEVAQGRWDPIAEARALTYFAIATMRRPALLAAHHNLAGLYLARLRHDVSRKRGSTVSVQVLRAVMAKSQTFDPRDALTMLADLDTLLLEAELGAGHRGQAQLEEARRAVARCLEAGPRHLPCLLVSVRFGWAASAAGDADALAKALRESQRLVALYPRSGLAHHALAETHRRLLLVEPPPGKDPTHPSD